jgi:hypothetical protein
MSSAKQELYEMLPDTYVKSLEERFDCDYEDILTYLENDYYVMYRVAEERITGYEWSSMMASYNKDEAKLCRDLWLKCAAIKKKYFPVESV